MQTFLPLRDVVVKNSSMTSIKLSSADSINVRTTIGHQVRPIRHTFCPTPSSITSAHQTHKYNTASQQPPPYTSPARSITQPTSYRTVMSSIIPEAVLEIPEVVTISRSNSPATVDGGEEEVLCPRQRIGPQKPTTLRFQMSRPYGADIRRDFHSVVDQSVDGLLGKGCGMLRMVDFNLNSVGRSFIDDEDEEANGTISTSLTTPETPTPNISPSSSNRFSETFYTGTDAGSQAAPSSPSIVVSPMLGEPTASSRTLGRALCGSWDVLEVDLDFHDVNFDPSYGVDLEECIYFGDDPLGLLPIYPTAPDGVDL